MTGRPLISFFAIAFAIAWGVPAAAVTLSAAVERIDLSLALYSPVYYLAVWSPAIAALAVIARAHGFGGVMSYLMRLFYWRARGGWYLFVFAGIPLLYLGAAAIAALWEEGALLSHLPSLTPFLWGSLLVLTAGPVEELGWRGFALPLLQRRFTGLGAAIVLGVIWGLWHLPALVAGQVSAGGTGLPFGLALFRFVLQTTAFSVIFTIFYNGTGGALPLVILLHWMGNLPYPWEGEADLLTAQTAALTLAALVLVLSPLRRYLGPHDAARDVAPGVFPPIGGGAPRLDRPA